MPEPKMGASFEKKEQPIKFVIMPGRKAGEGESYSEAGEPAAWFVRPEGSRSTRIETQEEDSIATHLTEMFGDEYLDFITGPLGGTSKEAKKRAEALADVLNTPGAQSSIQELLDEKKALAKEIATREQAIARKVENLQKKLKGKS